MPQTINLSGQDYVVLLKDEYERLARAARLPVLPEAGPNGEYPAVEYARSSLARKLILRREALGWNQSELARRAKVRAEVLCRLETGKVTPSLKTVEKLDAAMKSAESMSSRSQRS